MCTRIKYETGTGTCIVGRGMDWNDPDEQTDLWVFPKGMQRTGDEGASAATWVSKFGSVIASFYDAATVDGINEAGLVGNVLYLAESDYGDAAKTGKPTLSIGAWAQYFLDNFASVEESVAAMQDDPFTVVAPILPNGRAATGHLALSDPSGDSAILEYLDGKLVIHHGPEHAVLTNSPTYDQQIAINAYWELIGGDRMLPGTISAADRYVRASYFLKSSPKYVDRRMAVASVFSQMRTIGVPLGLDDPDHPNIAATLWRTVHDHDARRLYFESAIRPATFWVDLDKVNLDAGAEVLRLETLGPKSLAGEVSAAFEPAEPFAFLTA
ncbi:linear amide C-N hydrolase [Mycolicibacterium palauense]|uniref:linear amide C-N hydrolase n=1 Tax=Mycolicibacterium palauense TaxID=2034511 RepID=UPI000BFED36B|nr:linear amide C-N hydrolase [Mycolicibacterium palauense]